MDITNDLFPFVDGLHHTQAAIDAVTSRRELTDLDKEIIQDLHNARAKMITRLREKV